MSQNVAETMDYMLQLQKQNPEAYKQFMVNIEKRRYVDEHHKHKISEIKDGLKKGMWRTRITPNSGKKTDKMLAKTCDDLYAKLYDFYKEKERKTLGMVFEERASDEINLNGIKERTVNEKRRVLQKIGLSDYDIVSLTSDDIKAAIVKYIKNYNDFRYNDERQNKPRQDEIKRILQIISSVYVYALDKGYCTFNPCEHIQAKNYYSQCRKSSKADEMKTFTDEQCQMIRDDILANRFTPAAAATYFSTYSDLRLGELLGLYKEDIHADYVHIHRQYLGNEQLDYTKNERMNPRGGRRIPITKGLRDAIERALNLPGDSVYLFHDANGKPIRRDSYTNNLRRRCDRLGIAVHHNHAFRVHYNGELIDMGMSASDRALLMGHSVEVNERFYSRMHKNRYDAAAKMVLDYDKKKCGE